MKIKQIFDEISSEPGSNMKMNILSKYTDNKLLEKVLYLSCSNRIKFYIKQIPAYSNSSNTLTLDNALDMLKDIYIVVNIQVMKQLII